MTALDWQDRRVVITGARGFIASRLGHCLSGLGAVVHGVSRQPAWAGAQGITCIQADLTDPVAARHLLAAVKPDIVFHLAGYVTGSQALGEVEPTFLMNLGSTVHLLTAAAEEHRCRIVLCGSMQEPQDLSATPCSPYAASKWACSAYMRLFHGLYGLPVVMARPFMVYGPGQWDTTKLLPYVIVSLLKGQAPRVGSGERELDWIYVDDVVKALLTIGAAMDVDGHTVDVGSGHLTSVRGIIDTVRTVLDSTLSATYGAVADRLLERSRAANVDEAIRLTGWRAETPLLDGLARTVDWYRRQVAAGLL